MVGKINWRNILWHILFYFPLSSYSISHSEWLKGNSSKTQIEACILWQSIHKGRRRRRRWGKYIIIHRTIGKHFKIMIHIFYITLWIILYHFNILLSEGKQFSTILTLSLITTSSRCANVEWQRAEGTGRSKSCIIPTQWRQEINRKCTQFGMKLTRLMYFCWYCTRYLWFWWLYEAGAANSILLVIQLYYQFISQ